MRFMLRDLLWLVLVIATFSAWWGERNRRVETHRALLGKHAALGAAKSEFERLKQIIFESGFMVQEAGGFMMQGPQERLVPRIELPRDDGVRPGQRAG